MDKTLFEDFQQSLKEAVAIRRTEVATGEVTGIHTQDAKGILNKVSRSQTKFGPFNGVKLET